jgi:D-alanine-D-alanine ligase
MTATSLLPQSAAAEGIDYGQLCDAICKDAIERWKRR